MHGIEHLIAVTLLAGLFFIGIPSIGAFSVRKKWRQFRNKINEASLFPIVRFADFYKRDEGYIGPYRFFGVLQAIQENDIIWVKNTSCSICAELKDIDIYLLPEVVKQRGKEILPDEPLQHLSWNKVMSVPEGTEIFIAGALYNEGGKGIFRKNNSQSLTIVIYDQSPEILLKRSIWGGRQKNEYWNSYTYVSIFAGTFFLFFYAYLLLRLPIFRFPALAALTMSVVPLLPLLPPGVVFFYVYISFWRRGRYYRALRDIFLLPTRYFHESEYSGPQMECRLPTGEPYALLKFGSLDEGFGCMPFIRETAVFQPLYVPVMQYYGFGVPVLKEGKIKLTPPRDPMADYVIFPGNPDLLSFICRRKARKFEILSGGAFFIAFFMNYFIAFNIFGFLIR